MDERVELLVLPRGSLLAGQRTVWAYHPTTRSVKNLVRNTVLVALEARPQGLASLAHEVIGLAALAVVCAAVVALMKAPRRAARLPEIAR